MELNHGHKLAAILLSEGGEISKKELFGVWGFDSSTLTEAVGECARLFSEDLVELVESEMSVKLSLTGALSEFIHAHEKDLTNREITNAQSEVLACVLYKGPLSKAEIDELRGVDSRSSLKELLKRGYIEYNHDRLLVVTAEALSTLGLSRPTDAPEYETISTELQQDARELES